MGKSKSHSADTILKTLISMLVGAYFIISVLPAIASGFNNMAGDTVNFTAQQIVLITLFGIVTVLSVLYLYLKQSGLIKG